MTGPRVVYSGALAQQPANGGLAWFHLQFLLGLRRLGCDVLFVDRVGPEMCRDAAGRPCGLAESVNLRFFRAVVRQFGLEGNSALIYDRGREVVGAPLGRVREFAASADFVLNVMGYLDDESILGRARRRVFLDIDPGFGQMWRELGLHDAFRGHDAFVTVGLNVGRAGCDVPTCGLDWVTTPQPVVLDLWPEAGPPPAGAAFTAVGAWRGPNGPVEYRGRTYGLRVHEFRRFVEVPAACPGTRFELALDIHPADANDADRLRQNGWHVVAPAAVAGTPDAYRDYVAASKAEFMVPKQMYVATHSGLLSDRSAYYLASGRPVLARDTGFSHHYPTGDGLLAFATPEEAAAGVERINADYERHCRAARELAAEFFDSDKVLARLLDRLGAGRAPKGVAVA